MSDFYLDEDIDARLLAPRLEARGHSARSTRQAGRLGTRDDEQLPTATDLGRHLIAHNGRDVLYPAWRSLARPWRVASGDHAGIVVVPQAEQLSPERLASEIHGLVRAQPSTWGRFFELDVRWGWQMEP